MPTPGKCWRHIVLNTHSSWLHGDPRGFRSRGHRIHSSGDYRNPPPPQEHLGLHLHQIARSAEETKLPQSVFAAMGEAIVTNLHSQRHLLAALYVGSMHTHLLAEYPESLDELRKICGWCKYFATRAARRVEPGLKGIEIWAEGEGYTPVRNSGHFANAVHYILYKQAPSGWTWKPATSAEW